MGNINSFKAGQVDSSTGISGKNLENSVDRKESKNIFLGILSKTSNKSNKNTTSIKERKISVSQEEPKDLRSVKIPKNAEISENSNKGISTAKFELDGFSYTVESNTDNKSINLVKRENTKEREVELYSGNKIAKRSKLDKKTKEYSTTSFHKETGCVLEKIKGNQKIEETERFHETSGKLLEKTKENKETKTKEIEKFHETSGNLLERIIEDSNGKTTTKFDEKSGDITKIIEESLNDKGETVKIYKNAAGEITKTKIGDWTITEMENERKSVKGHSSRELTEKIERFETDPLTNKKTKIETRIETHYSKKNDIKESLEIVDEKTGNSIYTSTKQDGTIFKMEKNEKGTFRSETYPDGTVKNFEPELKINIRPKRKNEKLNDGYEEIKENENIKTEITNRPKRDRISNIKTKNDSIKKTDNQNTKKLKIVKLKGLNSGNLNVKKLQIIKKQESKIENNKTTNKEEIKHQEINRSAKQSYAEFEKELKDFDWAADDFDSGDKF